MEPRFGRDFSHVRVHDDAAAGSSARAIGAQAYTAGADIVLDSDRHPSGSSGERRLLAHELTHVAQQPTRTAAAPGALEIQEHPTREAEANRTADAVVRGRAHTPTTHTVDAGAVQRETEASAAGSPAGGGSAGAASGAAAAAPCIEAVVGEDPKTLTEAGTVTIVEFGAEWCSPCKMLQASLEQMCQGFRANPPKAPVRIFSIDIDAAGNEEIASRYAASDVPHLYMYVGGAEKAHYNTALQPDVLEALVAEYADEASQSGAWKGFKKGAFWGGLIGLGLGIGGAVALSQTGLEGNALMGGILGSVAGGALAGAAIGGGIGALAGKLGEEKKGSRRKKKKPKRRGGTVYEADELEADAIAARAMSGTRRHREGSPDAIPAGVGGVPIDGALRFDMESRFGRDFSRVRLHRDADAHRVADGMQAYAVTEGSDIYFARDGYAPNTTAGRAILAHELAHVAQQDSSGPSAAAPALESEAARAADSFVAGRPFSVQHAAGDGTPPLPITRGKKTALGGLIGTGAGAAAGALVGLGVAALSSDVSAAAGAGIGALIGAGTGLIAGLLTGYFSRRTERVGAAEADALIRRRYGHYMPGGVPAPLRNALIRPVSSAELCERVRCRRPSADCNLIGWTDTGVPWRAGAPPTDTIERPEDEPTCNGKKMEHATPERPVIYFQRDTPDAGILVHEGLHAISHPEFQRLHNVVNEGATELYTRRLLEDVNIAVHGTGYDDNVRAVEKLERLVGEAPLARAYFGGDIPGLDSAAAAIFGPCSLQHWAFELQANHGVSQAADSVLAGRNIDSCAQGWESLGGTAATPSVPGGDGEGHHK